MPKELIKQLVTLSPDQLRLVFAQTMPADLADVLASLTDAELLVLLPRIDATMLAVVMQEFPDSEAARFFSLMPIECVIQVIYEMSSDDAADLLLGLPEEQRQTILSSLPEDSDYLQELLAYDEESSGSIMATEFLTVRPNWTAEQALQMVRRDAQEAETAYYIYVTSKAGHLQGVLSLRELVLAKPDTVVSQFMRKDPIKVTPEEDQETVAALFRRYDLVALPVVDNKGVLKGIVTGDDILDVVDDEATEDIERMAALHPSDTPYLASPIFKLASQRLMWLLVLMVSATFTGRILSRFEDVLSQVVVLTFFIPMLMDSGGNAGSQSSTLIIRGLALGDITPKDWFKVVRKEVLVSGLVGAGLALVNFVRILVLEQYPLDIAIVVTITLFLTIVIAKMTGGLLPIAAKLLNIDPAIMAGPLITTIVDALALIVYFSLATAMFGL